MRAEGHAFGADGAQLVEAENLESPGVGENRPGPRHETMQAAELADLFHSRPQVEVIGIAEKNLDPEFFKNVLRNALDGGQRADRHEHRRFDLPVRGEQAAGTGRAGSRFDVKLEGHSLGL